VAAWYLKYIAQR